MNSCVFAQELVDNIIDHLYDDTSTLRQCSLFCRAWVPSSRMHLFRLLCFEPPSRQHSVAARSYKSAFVVTPKNPDPCELCYQLLMTSPHIVPYVQELRIHARIELYQPRVEKSIALPRLLPLLVQLRRVEITGIDRRAISADLRSSIHIVLRFPLLVRVHLENCAIPKSISHHSLFGSWVKHLTVNGVKLHGDGGLMDTPSGDIDTGCRQMQLESLEIIRPGEPTFYTIDWILASNTTITGNTTSLLKLLVSSELASMPSLGKLLRLSVNLCHFEFQPILYYRENLDSSFPFPDISCNKFLRSLYLSELSARKAFNNLPWLISFFSHIRSFTKLEAIMMEANISLNGTGDEWALVWNGWTDLDRVLCQPEFGSLREVKLRFLLPPGQRLEPVDQEWLPKGTMFRMSGLAAKGILHIKVLNQDIP